MPRGIEGRHLKSPLSSCGHDVLVEHKLNMNDISKKFRRPNDLTHEYVEGTVDYVWCVST